MKEVLDRKCTDTREENDEVVGTDCGSAISVTLFWVIALTPKSCGSEASNCDSQTSGGKEHVKRKEERWGEIYAEGGNYGGDETEGYLSVDQTGPNTEAQGIPQQETPQVHRQRTKLTTEWTVLYYCTPIFVLNPASLNHPRSDKTRTSSRSFPSSTSQAVALDVSAVTALRVAYLDPVASRV